jgi:hypothetical protein
MNTMYVLSRRMRLAPAPLLSREARTRLTRMDYYHERRNVSKTCRRFGIAHKTFSHRKNRYELKPLESLEDASPPVPGSGNFRGTRITHPHAPQEHWRQNRLPYGFPWAFAHSSASSQVTKGSL